MSIINGFIVVAALAASTVAVAQPAQISDTQYLAVARCRALIASPALGKQDTSAIDSVLKAQGRARVSEVIDRADEVQSDASRAARRAEGEQKAKLVAERDGVCQVFASGADGQVMRSGAGR
jgi:hypothetical protein